MDKTCADFNNLIINQGERLIIDGVELKSITHYELKHSAGLPAEFTIKMNVIVHQADSE